MPSARPAHVREHLLEVLGPVVAATGYDLEDVAVTAAGRRNLVKVVVDSDDGVDLDAISEVSRVVSERLDDASTGDVVGIAGSYVLEVSSPGVDRPLTEPRHWRRAHARLVRTTIGDAAVTGRVVGTDDAGVTLEVEGARREVPWADLGAGRVQVEFHRAGED